MREKVTLDGIFSLQEQLLERNKKEFLKRYEFIKDCLELVLNVQTDGATIEQLGKKAICKMFNTFYFAGRSSLISALKLLLYGVPGDSMACLRISWESFVCIDYANEFDAFDELKRDVLLKREEVKYKKYAQRLKQKDNAHRLRVWGELTQFGSHLSYQKLAIQHFFVDGRKATRVGMGALDEKIAFNASAGLIQMAMYMVNVVKTFYEKNIQSAIQDEFFVVADSLSKRYEEIVTEAREQMKIWGKALSK